VWGRRWRRQCRSAATNFTPCDFASPSIVFNAAVVSLLEQCSYSRPAIQLPRSNWPSQALESPHQEQASSFAYFDVFLMLTVVTLGLVPMVLDETPGGPERRHIAGE
jgi:hypothetical protein